MRYWMFFAFILLFVTLPEPVQACSGGAGPWSEWLPQLIERSDALVVGQYAELDDAERNGIFHVRSYFKGNGAEFLTISVVELAWIENSLNVGRYYGCWMDFGMPIPTNGEYLYFLHRQENGIYTISHRRYFPEADSTITISETAGEYIEISLAELSAQIVSHTGEEFAPLANTAYPRTSPILLKNHASDYFLLPVDSPELVPVTEESLGELQRNQYACYVPCTAFSPNGLDKIFLHESEDTFQRLAEFSPTIEHNLIGQRLSFSSTSETFALWKDNQIELYMLWNPQLNFPVDWTASMHSPALINTIPSEASLDYPAVWSSDGRTLAFSDDEGLWLWDVFSVDYPPQLLIPAAETLPTARYFSPQGRYLAITEGERHYNLDLVTRRELPDGYISPNDRILLVFDTAGTEPRDLQVQYLAPEQAAFEYYADVQYSHVQWTDNEHFLASVTGLSYLEFDAEATGNGDEAIFQLVEEPFHDVTIYWLGQVENYQTVPYDMISPQMRDFYYQAGQGLIEISADGYSLNINNRHLDLSPYLTSPIAEAVWLPSAFYYER